MLKITKKELKYLQEQDQQKKAILHDLGLLQTQSHTLNHMFAELMNEVGKNKLKLEDKYGNVNIDLSDGSITPKEDGKK